MGTRLPLWVHVTTGNTFGKAPYLCDEKQQQKTTLGTTPTTRWEHTLGNTPHQQAGKHHWYYIPSTRSEMGNKQYQTPHPQDGYAHFDHTPSTGWETSLLVLHPIHNMGTTFVPIPPLGKHHNLVLQNFSTNTPSVRWETHSTTPLPHDGRHHTWYYTVHPVTTIGKT